MNETINSQMEQRNPGPRIISLGEKFRPFDPTDIDNSPFDNGIIRPTVVLSIENKDKISFTIQASSSHTQKMRAITPFNPELGYQIDSQDMELETRMAKIKNLREDLERQIEFEKAPFFLSIVGRIQEINAGQADEENINSEFSTELLETIRRLRILVSFPQGRYEARPWELTLKINCIWFHDFYPVDAGHLPTSATHRLGLEDEGFALFLPNDPEELSQIKVMFVLAPENPNKGGES